MGNRLLCHQMWSCQLVFEHFYHAINTYLSISEGLEDQYLFFLYFP